MGQLLYLLPYKIATDLVLTPQEIRTLYSFGIPFVDTQGNQLSDDTVRFYIKAAMKEVERHLMIKLQRQIFTETRDYIADDFEAWSFTKTSYPIERMLSLEGWIGNQKQVTYPPHWLSVRQSADEDLIYRQFHMVPGGHGGVGVQNNSVEYSGITPSIGWFGNRQVPNYWHITYITGFRKVPQDIIDVIGKLAVCSIFVQLNDLVNGPGLGNSSLSIDGLSQSISTSGYASRLKAYGEELEKKMKALENYYKPLTFGVC